MKILFDECVPRRFKLLLSEHSVKTVPEAGWAGIKNGELLKQAAGRFDLFVTVDRNLAFQQNTETLLIPVVVIQAKSNRLKDLEPFAANLILLLSGPLLKKVYVLSC